MEERIRRAALRLAGALVSLLLPAAAAGAAASPTSTPPASATPAASASPKATATPPAAEVPVVDAAARRIRLPARVAEQTLYFEERRGEIEYVLCAEGGKAYEALFVTRAEPQALYDALAQIGLRPGRSAEEADGGRMRPPEGGRLSLTVEWEADGRPRSAPVEEFILDAASGAPLAPVDWFFTGSRKVYDPEHDADVLEAVLVRNLVALHHLDRGVLIQRALPRAGEAGRYRTNLKALPKPGTAVTLLLAAAEAQATPAPATPKTPPAFPEPSARPAGSPRPRASPTPKTAPPATRRIHAFVSGEVQGVGFRAFTQEAARRLGLCGWVRNLPDGRVELEAEGSPAALAELEGLMQRGPSTARVTGVDVRESSGGAGEKLGEFEVRATPARSP